MVNKKTKEYLLRKETEKWIKDNKGMIEDYQKICHDVLMFKAMWGIDIGIILKNPEEKFSRDLGKK